MNSAIPHTAPIRLDGQLQLDVAQRTAAGQKTVNEDAIGIRIPSGKLLTTKGAIAAIADGVSAAESGKEASETCVQGFINDYYSTPDSWSVQKSGMQVLTALNRWLFTQGRHFQQARHGYVSTLTVLIIESRTAYIFHVGDCRVYRLRGGELELMSSDHVTQISKQRSYLARAIGLDQHVQIDYREEAVDADDLFLLCTDGIYNCVERGVIETTLEQGRTNLEATCDTLMQLAGASSDDNLSCQLVRIDQLPVANADDLLQKLTALPFPPILRQGMVLDGLCVERALHSSNRSRLYLVNDTKANQQLVMKTPSVDVEDDAASIERFIMESWIGARINNQHVIKIARRPQLPTCIYYLTEYIAGLTLEQWMMEHPKASVNEALFLIEQLIKAVRALHLRDTLHQDIKPDNILLDANGLVKLIDFRSCQVAGIAEINVSKQPDGALASADYSAPEYFAGDHASGQHSDLFSIATILFEMLTGELPYSGKLADCRSNADLSRLSYIPCYQLNPLVPLWVDGALKKALQTDPDLRYKDVSEFLHDLKQPNPAFLARQTVPPIKRNTLRYWQATVAILVILQLATLFLLL